MLNIDKLLDTVKPIDHFNYSGKILNIKSKSFDGRAIYKILEGVKWASNQLPNKKLSIQIKSTRFASADVVSVMEIIMLYLAENFPNQWCVTFTERTITNNNVLFYNSILMQYNARLLGNSFIKAFHKKTLTKTHFRFIVELNTFLEDNKTISDYCDDIFVFLKHAFIDMDDFQNEKLSCDLYEACSEVIHNVFDHTETDCLVDIKSNRVSTGNILFSVNVISLSDVYIGTKIIKTLDEGLISKYSGSNIVLKAYDYHSKHFSEHYDKSAFGFVCAFQRRVSTRENSTQSGGTGLTTLIKRIHGKKATNAYFSYIISGNNMLRLNTDYLDINQEGLIGFNDSNSFYDEIPNDKIVVREENCFPGTIFSISLLL